MDDLNAAKTADVQAFFDLYYAPNNATLVVAGDFEPADAKRLIEQYFGEHPAEPARHPAGRLRPAVRYRAGPAAGGGQERQPAGGDADLPRCRRTTIPTTRRSSS